jgi:AcrR family transcriptional regulator
LSSEIPETYGSGVKSAAAGHRSVEHARRPLDRETILREAVRLVDRQGLGALNMRELAEQVGAGTMSLYHHVPGREALLDGIVEQVLGEIELPPPSLRGWKRRIGVMARSFHDVSLRHPNCVPLLVTRPFASDAALRPCEGAFTVLAEAGFSPDRALVVFRTIVSYVLGYVMMEAAGFLGGLSEDTDPADLAGHGLPSLARIAPILAGRDVPADFEDGLRIILDGTGAKR